MRCTQRAFINTEHMEFERSCRERIGRRDITGVKNAKALWPMKVVWDRSEDYDDPARKEDILGRTRTRLDLWEPHLKDPIVALATALDCLENLTGSVAASLCRRNGLQHSWCKDFAKDCGKALLDTWDVVRLRIQLLERPEEVWDSVSFSFFFIRKEPLVLTQAVPFEPLVSAETLKACALTGLHLLAAEDEAGSSGSQSPDLGDMWGYGCQKSSDWDSDVESWTESEGIFSSDQCEHDVESLALNVVEQDQ